MDSEAGEIEPHVPSDTKLSGQAYEFHPPTITEACTRKGEETLYVFNEEEEDCQCKCKKVHMQALEIFKSKVATLADVNGKATQMLRSETCSWNDEKGRLLGLMSELEIKVFTKDQELQALQERLLLADGAVQQLSKTKMNLEGELFEMQSEKSSTYEKLMDLEHVSLSLQKAKEDEIESLSAALHATNAALNNAQAVLADKAMTIHELSVQILSLKSARQQCVLAQEECFSKIKDVHTLSASHQGLKEHLQTEIKGHEQEMNYIKHELQKSLDSIAFKDSEVEAFITKVHGSQVALNNAEDMKSKDKLESFEFVKDLAKVKETLCISQKLLKLAAEEANTLSEAINAKEVAWGKQKIQLMENEKAQKEQIESLQQELEECKSAEQRLLTALKKEQQAVNALEDMREQDLKSGELEQSSWKEEREKLLMDLSGMDELLKLKGLHEKELEEKLLRADDAIRQAMDSRTSFEGEVSELKQQLQKAHVQQQDTESAHAFLESFKQDEVLSLSNLLHARLMELEMSRQEVEQHQKTIIALSDNATCSRELTEKISSLETALKAREEELHVFSLFQEKSKINCQEIQEEHCKETDDLVVQLEKALECKARAEERLKEREPELECLRMIIEKANIATTKSDTKLNVLQESLAKLQEENCLLQHNLHEQGENARIWTDALKESLFRRETELVELKQYIADVEAKLSKALQHEQKWQEGAIQCEAIRGELSQRRLLQENLREIHQKEISNWSDKESNWHKEMESLMSRACGSEEKLLVTEGQLETVLSELKCLTVKYEQCEHNLATCQGEVAQLQSKLDESHKQLCSKEQEIQNLQNKLNGTSSSLRALSEKKDSALIEAMLKIERLESEAQMGSAEFVACTDQVEALKKDLHLHEMGSRDLEETVTRLSGELLRKAEEILELTERKGEIEVSLVDAQKQFMLARKESELQVETLKEILSALELRLNQTLQSKQKNEKEMESFLKNTEEKDAIMQELRTLNRSLVEEKEMLKQSVKAWSGKSEMLTMAMEGEKSLSKNLQLCIEDKDRSIESLSNELRSLQNLVNLSKPDSEKVIEYEDKVKCLESDLAETSLCLRETEERLSASEWAVQQLANEVAKAKSSLAQRERDEILSQSRLSDMEARIKAKERELEGLDVHVRSLVHKNSQKQMEVERLTETVETLEIKAEKGNIEAQRLTLEMQQIGIALESKQSALAHLEEHLKQGQSKETLMEDAIESLKFKLETQIQLSSDNESKIKEMLDELESSHTKESLMARSLKEAENKLQQADQRFKEELIKTNKLMHEEEEKLATGLMLNCELKQDLGTALELIEKQKERISAGTEAAASREVSLKDLTCEFESLQEEVSAQRMQIKQCDEDLVQTNAQLVLSKETVTNLNEKMYILNEEMDIQVKKLTSQLALSNSEIYTKENELQQLRVVEVSLKDLTCEFESLQEEVSAQRMQIKQRDEELVQTNAQLVLSKETVTNLNEKMHFLNEEMDTQVKKLTSQLALSNSEISTKENELQRLRVVEKAMVTMSAEREALVNEMNKLKIEADMTCISIERRDAEILRLRDSIKELDIEMIRLRDENFRKDKDLKSIGMKLQSAEKKCLAAEHKIQTLEKESVEVTMQCRLQLQEQKILVASNSVLKEELEKKEIMSRDEIHIMNGKFNDYLRKETTMQAEIAQVSDKIREILDLSVQHEAEEIQPVASEILQTLRQLSIEGPVRTDFVQRKSVEQMPLTMCAKSERLESAESLAPLQLMVQELESAERRRLKMEANIFEMTRRALYQVTHKEQERQDLMKQIESLKKRVDIWDNGIKDVLGAQLEFEKELCVLSTLNHCTESIVEAPLAFSSPQDRASLLETNQLSKKWKSTINTFKEMTLATVCSLKEEAADNNCKFHATEKALTVVGCWSKRLKEEALHVKKMIRTLVLENRQKNISLEEASKTISNMQSCLQQKVMKEKEANELVGFLQVLLVESSNTLNEDHTSDPSRTPPVHLHIEMESSEPSRLQGNYSSRSELEQIIILAEKLSKDVKLKSAIYKNELSRLRYEAEGAINISQNLREQLEESRNSFFEKEQRMAKEFQGAKEKAQSYEKEASNLRTSLAEASQSKTRLEHLIRKEEEKLSGVQVQINDLKEHLELKTQRNSDLEVNLSAAKKQIESLNLKLELLEKEQISMQEAIDTWKDDASLANDEKLILLSQLLEMKDTVDMREKAASLVHDEKLALLSQLREASQRSAEAVKRHEEEKRGLTSEARLWEERAQSSVEDNDLLKSQLETYAKSVEDLQGRLKVTEDANCNLRVTCKKLRAEIMSVQDASQQREKMLGDALAEIQQGSRRSTCALESRIQLLHEAMTLDNDDTEACSVKQTSVKPDNPRADGKGALFDWTIGGTDRSGSSSSHLCLSNSRDVGGTDNVQHPQHDLDNYLELCDSLIRRHAELETMLQNLETRKTLQQDQRQLKLTNEAGPSDLSDNKKKRMINVEEVGGQAQTKEKTRKPLQQIAQVYPQPVMSSTPSPAAKRRRSSSDSFHDQNSCQ